MAAALGVPAVLPLSPLSFCVSWAASPSRPRGQEPGWVSAALAREARLSQVGVPGDGPSCAPVSLGHRLPWEAGQEGLADTRLWSSELRVVRPCVPGIELGQRGGPAPWGAVDSMVSPAWWTRVQRAWAFPGAAGSQRLATWCARNLESPPPPCRHPAADHVHPATPTRAELWAGRAEPRPRVRLDSPERGSDRWPSAPGGHGSSWHHGGPG